MKKFIVIFSAVLISTSALAISESEIHVLDAKRMELEKIGDDSALIKMLSECKDKTLRDGLIYSLGKLKSDAAFDKIFEIALNERDDSPAAVLALGEYKNKRAIEALNKLAPKSKVAKSALFIAARPPENSDAFGVDRIGDFYNLDENAQVEILYALNPKSEKASRFLLSIEPKSERIAVAASFALSRMGGATAADKIISFSEMAGREPAFATALALTDNAEKSIATAILKGNLCAVKAAGIRASAECEDALLKALKSADCDMSRDIYQSIGRVGAEKSAKTLIADFGVVEKSSLIVMVQTLTAVLGRLDAASRDSLFADSQKTFDAYDDFRKSAIKRAFDSAK